MDSTDTRLFASALPMDLIEDAMREAVARGLSDAEANRPRPPISLPSCKETLLLGPGVIPLSTHQRTIRLSPEELAALSPAAAPREEVALPQRSETPSAPAPASAPAPTSAPARVEVAPQAVIRPTVTPAVPVSPARTEAPRARLRTVLFVVLGVMLLVGVGVFVAIELLVSTNKGWLAPTVLTSTDGRVLQVAATIQQETARQSDLSLSRKELATRLREAERWVAVEETFQTSFRAALESDLQAHRTELRRVRALLEAERQEGPSDDELEKKLATVRDRIRILEAASRNPRGTGAYDTLALRREYDRSVVASEKAREVAAALTKALADTDEVLRQKEALLASLRASPYSLAIDGDVALAFVPYENRRQVEAGAPIFACKTSLLFCRRVGALGAPLPGEIQGSHPLDGRALRGQLYRLTLAEPRSAERPLLYAGRPPL
jgi:hypothetical protein